MILARLLQARPRADGVLIKPSLCGSKQRVGRVDMVALPRSEVATTPTMLVARKINPE